MKPATIQPVNTPPYFEPAFYFAHVNRGLKHRITMKADFLPDSMATFFEYRLKQQRGDLNCHLQRIKFFLYRKHMPQLFTALCDLFIVLGNSGHALRQRLCKSTKNILNSNQSTFLEQALSKQLDNTDVFLPQDCLFKKTHDNLLTDIVTDMDSHNVSEDILATADSYIENSQFDAALEYMTEHLKQQSENKALTRKLIELYQVLNMEQKFNQACQQFADQASTAQLWHEARQTFN